MAIASDFISSQQQSGVKQYIVYDASNRMVTTYVASAAAKNGDPCMRTDYVYQGTSPRIIKMKETSDFWNSSWDF